MEDEYESLPTHSIPVHLAAGALAGAVEHCVMFPFDSVKTRMQSLCPCPEMKCPTPVHSLYNIVKREGWLRPLRGMNAVAAGSMPAHALYFTVYEKTKEFLTGNTAAHSNSLAYAASGVVATMFHDAIMNPAEVVKQRMQMAFSPYGSSLECVRCIYRREGFIAFYRSYTTQLTLNIPFQTCHFVTYEFVQQILNPDRHYDPKSHMIAGGIAGGLAAALTTPLDCIKTVLNTQQTATVEKDGAKNLLLKATLQYRGFSDAAAIILSSRGYGGFFCGLQARILFQMRMRLFLKTAVRQITGSSRRQASTLSHNELRRLFFSHFESHNHVIVPSSSIIPREVDDSVLFVNSGMFQFKDIFLGSRSHLTRAASIQKCVRAGGKHNDLEDVGRDLHHHTFFEMMGNWAFSNAYSKEEACRMSWGFLCDVIGIDPARLYVTYYAGSQKLGIPPDNETKDIWKRIGLPDDRIVPFKSENFWEMGSVGPCGPSTEIHFDRIGPNRPEASRLVNRDNSVVELWNIVFISYERKPNKSIVHLPATHIDTGMGFERLLSVVQNVDSNFDTELFQPMFNKIKTLVPAEIPCYSGRVGKEDVEGRDAVYRIMADHSRAVAIAVSEGLKVNHRNYWRVIRKMIRRCLLLSTDKLHFPRYAFSELFPVVADTLKDPYIEVFDKLSEIEECIKKEEKLFWGLIDNRWVNFDKAVNKAQGTSLNGESLYTIYEMTGLPIEMICDMATERHYTFNVGDFHAYLADHKVKSRTRDPPKSFNHSDFANQNEQPKYEYKLLENGEYEFPIVSSSVYGLFSSAGRVSSLQPGHGFVVLKDCQFYADQGGQEGDTGVLKVNGKVIFEVESTMRHNGIVLLRGEAKETLREGQKVEQCIDVNRRLGLMRAHSATHLLNWATRQLGVGAGQDGSHIYEDHLRYEYIVNGRPNSIEVEKIIQKVINKKLPLTAELMDYDEAQGIERLQSDMINKGDYPEKVRVVGFGESVRDDGAVAVEACCGT
ncbi:hypothetical protein WR25_03897 [Diploscapter pachys]|uniref:alanine--tRNA ligase n=1 Tax=Diploscapter pachys TaxID=2018661 RepID=A0A2A2JMI9_9BILA|nr:hypothetical protein WR25_03897 [Diploscapter pachys]